MQHTDIHQSLQLNILTGGGSTGWSGVLRRSPSFHIEGTHSDKVMHSLHLEQHQIAKLSLCINYNHTLLSLLIHEGKLFLYCIGNINAHKIRASQYNMHVHSVLCVLDVCFHAHLYVTQLDCMFEVYRKEGTT